MVLDSKLFITIQGMQQRQYYNIIIMIIQRFHINLEQRTENYFVHLAMHLNARSDIIVGHQLIAIQFW